MVLLKAFGKLPMYRKAEPSELIEICRAALAVVVTGFPKSLLGPTWREPPSTSTAVERQP